MHVRVHREDVSCRGNILYGAFDFGLVLVLELVLIARHHKAVRDAKLQKSIISIIIILKAARRLNYIYNMFDLPSLTELAHEALGG